MNTFISRAFASTTDYQAKCHLHIKHAASFVYVKVEPVLQDITGEELNRGAHTAPDARLDIVARGFWERQRSGFFYVRVCRPNADSYRDMDPDQIFRQHETEKKRQYASRVLEVEQAPFTPLVFSTTGGMAVECKRYTQANSEKEIPSAPIRSRA